MTPPLTAAGPAPLPAAERPGSVPDASALSFLAALAGAISGPAGPVLGLQAAVASPAGGAQAGPPVSQRPAAGLAGAPAIVAPFGRCAASGLANLRAHGGAAAPAADLFKAGGMPAVPVPTGRLSPSLAGAVHAEIGSAPPAINPAAVSAGVDGAAPPTVDPSGAPPATPHGAHPGVTAASRPALESFAPGKPAVGIASTASGPMAAKPPTGTAPTSAGAPPPTGKDAGVPAVEPEAGGTVPDLRTLGAGKARSGPASEGGELAAGGGMVPAPETAPACNVDVPSPQAQASREAAPQILPLSAPTGSADAVPAASPQTPPARPTVPVLAGEIVRAAGRGDDRLTVELQPAELGRVQVALSFDGEGRLRAEFAVDRPDTLQLLQRDAQALEESLGGGGLQLADAGLSFGLRRDRDAADPHQATPPHAGDPPQAAATQDPEAVRRRPATDRLLDLHV